MKKLVLSTALLLTSSIACAQAQASKGWWAPFPYYDNNPGYFCTLGVPWEGWVPLNPATGTFTITNPYDFNPVSAALYAEGCPWGYHIGGL